MNRKERAINLGLKINSLKGNFSVPKTVIKDLEIEISEALIDNSDRNRLIELYKKIVSELESSISPTDEEFGRINQSVQDIINAINCASNYLEADSIEGSIKSVEESLPNNKLLLKEQKKIIRERLLKLREKHRARVGFFLKRNFDTLYKNIKKECECDNPFHVSIVVKKYNEVVKKTPLFNDDRHTLQALLDSTWQDSAQEIKHIKQTNRDEDD